MRTLLMLAACCAAACKQHESSNPVVPVIPPLSVTEVKCLDVFVGYIACVLPLQDFMDTCSEGILQVIAAQDAGDFHTQRLFVVHTRYPGPWPLGTELMVTKLDPDSDLGFAPMLVPIYVGGGATMIVLRRSLRQRPAIPARDPLLDVVPVDPQPAPK